MQSYKRKITYFYQHHNGNVGSTAGFMKLEIRGDKVKININIQEPMGFHYREAMLYIYHEAGDHLAALKVDTIESVGGVLTYQNKTDWQNVFQTERDLYTFDGIAVVYNESHYYIGDFADKDRRDYALVMKESKPVAANTVAVLENKSMRQYESMQTHESARKHENVQNHETMQNSETIQNHENVQNYETMQNSETIQNHEKLYTQSKMHEKEYFQERNAEQNEIGKTMKSGNVANVENLNKNTSNTDNVGIVNGEHEDVHDEATTEIDYARSTANIEFAKLQEAARKIVAERKLRNLNQPKENQTETHWNSNQPKENPTETHWNPNQPKENPTETHWNPNQPKESQTGNQQNMSRKNETLESVEKERVFEGCKQCPYQEKRREQHEDGDAFEKMVKEYPKLPMYGANELFDCVRIHPKDIGQLDMRNWKLGVNSFLTHGFYTYQYLMLGKLRFEDGSFRSIIGVPGVFSNRERYLANMFGFDQFIPVKKTGVKTGEFGYWIVEIVS